MKSTPLTQCQPESPHRRLSAGDLWQAVTRHPDEVPAEAVSPLLPCLHRLRPRQHLLPQLPAPPLHCAMAAELLQVLGELVLAETMLAGAGLQAHREALGGPLSPLRRLARALLASCLTMARCARAPVRLLFHRCRSLRNHWQALKRRSRNQEQFGGEYLGLDTRPTRRCAGPMLLAPSHGTQGSSTQW